MQRYKQLYTAIKGDFLLPADYLGHEHQWVQLDAGLCLCRLCGTEHICFRGHCPTIQMEQSELVCSISGCVIVLSEMKAEWGALDRVHSQSALMPPRLAKKQMTAAIMHVRIMSASASPAPPEPPAAAPFSLLLSRRTATIHDTVETVVREILDSCKTSRCLADEMERDYTRRQACLAKLIRELVLGAVLERPNMLHLEAKLSTQCQKSRGLFHPPQASHLKHTYNTLHTQTYIQHIYISD